MTVLGELCCVVCLSVVSLPCLFSHALEGLLMTIFSVLQGSIVSCTKNQICLWTVNGTLLATANILITGNFKLMCCAVSEVTYAIIVSTKISIHVCA